MSVWTGQGRQYVCEYGGSRIQVFHAHDRPLEIVGQVGGRSRRIRQNWSVAFDSKGNLYVADSINHRVQKLVRRKSSRTRLQPPEKHQAPNFKHCVLKHPNQSEVWQWQYWCFGVKLLRLELELGAFPKMNFRSHSPNLSARARPGAGLGCLAVLGKRTCRSARYCAGPLSCSVSYRHRTVLAIAGLQWKATAGRRERDVRARPFGQCAIATTGSRIQYGQAISAEKEKEDGVGFLVFGSDAALETTWSALVDPKRGKNLCGRRFGSHRSSRAR